MAVAPTPRIEADDPIALLDAFSQAVVRVVERVAPAVAHVRRGRATGSGTVIAPDGYILTNAHVVDDARDVDIVFANGATYRASVIGADPATDLAVVRALAPGLPSLELATADTLRVGQLVIAIGGAPTPVGQQLARSLGLAASSGIRVLEVTPGGPAARAGVRPGDIVVGIDGATIASLTDLQRALDAERIGRSTLVTIIRRGERRAISVTPAEAA